MEYCISFITVECAIRFNLFDYPFPQVALSISKKILHILLEKDLLMPHIAKQFPVELFTELDFGKLNQRQFHLMENYLQLAFARCPVSVLY